MSVVDRPEIVCLCGSARFSDELSAANRELTLAGAIVVAPAVLPDAAEPITDEQRAELGALHLRKIDLADRVLVVNPGGYVGESTSREVSYARAAGKPVSFTHPDGPDGRDTARPRRGVWPAGDGGGWLSSGDS